MAAWRTLASVAVVLAVAARGGAQTYSLAEAPLAGQYFHYQIQMALEGEIKVQKGEDKVSLKQSAEARHDFQERVLNVGPDGLPRKVAQFFQTARAKLVVDRVPSVRTLKPEHCLLVAQRSGEQGLTYCPGGALTREEQELTEHFNTLALTGLLPGKAVAVGATWKVSNPVVQALCNFEGLTSQDLVCKLEQVKDQVAVVSVAGKAGGIDLGALVKLTIQATYQFDLRSRRLVRLDWQQQDERDQGPVSPVSAATVNVRLTRAAGSPVKELSDIALVKVPDGEPPLLMTQLSYTDKENRYEFLYDRGWYVVGNSSDHLILRLMDKGDFVAQVTITPWTKADPGKHLSGDEFQEAMNQTPGWEPIQVVQAGEVPGEDKSRWVYRISALGELDGVKVMQNFYLVANAQGEQVVLAFTMTPSQAKKIGTRDLTLVGSLEVPAKK